MTEWMARQPEPELMDDPAEALAYARADFAQVNDAFVDRLVELAGPVERAAALDIGAGPADIALRLHRRRAEWRITAVAAAPAMLDLARAPIQQAGVTEGPGSPIRLVLGDAKALPLAAGEFDVIYSNSIIHHLPDPVAMWREVRRLGRAGTVVLFRDLARPASPAAARAIVDKYAAGESQLLREEFYRSLLAAFTPEEVAEQLACAGLTMLKVQTITDRHYDVFGRM
jgi:ubiquinone/menaquinone biosynthesis C-methylase UbiE